MLGTLATAGGTLLLAAGVVIAGLQLRLQRRSAAADRRASAVAEMVAVRQMVVVRTKGGRNGEEDAERILIASERIMTEFEFAGDAFLAANLEFDMLFMEMVQNSLAVTKLGKPNGEWQGPLDRLHEVLARMTIKANLLLNRANSQKPNFGEIAEEFKECINSARSELRDIYALLGL